MRIDQGREDRGNTATRRSLALAVALIALLATSGPAAAQQNRRPDNAQATGGIAISVHAHSSEFDSPGGVDPLVGTQPLDYDFEEGDSFSYASIPCDVSAPFNDESLSFNPDFAGIDDPASARYIIEGTVTEYDEATGEGTVEGTLTVILCEDGEEGDRIFLEYEGTFVKADDEVRITGTFDIVGGTGVFSDLDGQGSINGSLLCLPEVLENAGAESCEDLGAFSDAVFQLHGTYQG